MQFPRLRNIDPNEMVSIEMPFHMWLSFLAVYSNTEWSSGVADALYTLVQEKLIDPLYLKEQQAAMQQHVDDQQKLFQQAWGETPEQPPNAEDMRDT